MSTEQAQALKDLADAEELIASATAVLAGGPLSPGHAACFAQLADKLARRQSRTQLHAAHALRRTGAHKLDQESFQAVTEAGEHPRLAAFQAAAGRTTTARTHFKNTAGLLHGWLDIPRSTVRDRLALVDCLLGGVDEAGQTLPAWLPELAGQFADPDVDPRLVSSAALKLHSARKDFGEGQAGQAKKDQLQAESAAFIRSEPKAARRHINALVAQVKSGQRPLQALLDGIGIFKKGMRQGLVEYVLRVLPAHAAMIEAYFNALDNPATVAGNREALAHAEAQFTGAQGSGWDDEESMPDWAKDGEPAGSAPEGSAEPEEPEEPDKPDEPGEPEEPDEPEEPEEPEEPAGPAATQFEELKPERRRLVGFLALLMTDRNQSGSPGKQPGLAVPQVSIILDYEKMRRDGKEFAVTSTGIQLSPGETRAALCTAGIYPLVLNGQSLPLDLGRTQRLYSKAQGRAIRAAYRGCLYPGCSMPAERCELDHLDAWEKGGNTDIESAALGCMIHHIGRHCGLFHAVKIPGCRPMALLSKELDPQQKLRVNTYWMTPQEALAADALAERMTAKWRAGELDIEIVEP